MSPTLTRFIHILAGIVFLALWLLTVADAAAMPGPELTVETDGGPVSFPLLTGEINADVRADLAMITVTQTFGNPLDQAAHGVYRFPLSPEARVLGFELSSGGVTGLARIDRIDRARARIVPAVQGGDREPARENGNVFVQPAPNLMPGMPVKVVLRYILPSSRVDGGWSLSLPLQANWVEGPEDGAAATPVDLPEAAKPEARAGARFDEDELEALAAGAGLAAQEAVPFIRQGGMTLRVRLSSARFAGPVWSPGHAIVEQQEPGGGRLVSLSSRGRAPNADLELRYRLASHAPRAVLLTEASEEGGGCFYLHIEPPVSAAHTVSPVMTDIRLDWGGLDVRETAPGLMEDLFWDRPWRLWGRFDGARTGLVTIRGRMNGRETVIPVVVQRIEDAPEGGLLPYFWAGARTERLLAEGGPSPDRETREEIIRLGLAYSLVTPYTEFAFGEAGGIAGVRLAASPPPVVAPPIKTNPAPIRRNVRTTTRPDTYLAEGGALELLAVIGLLAFLSQRIYAGLLGGRGKSHGRRGALSAAR